MVRPRLGRQHVKNIFNLALDKMEPILFTQIYQAKRSKLFSFRTLSIFETRIKVTRSKWNAYLVLKVVKPSSILLIGLKKGLLFRKMKVKGARKLIVTKKKFHTGMFRQKYKSDH